MPSAMVTFNGRITLPPHVRKQLGLRTGDSVEFVQIEDGRFAIAPRATGVAVLESDIEDPDGWVPQLDFSPTENEPRFKEPEEIVH